MGFLVDGIVKDLEYRGCNSGLRKDGKTWMSLRLDTLDEKNTKTYEINVPTEMQPDLYVLGLKRGDVLNVTFTARCGVAQGGRNYDYLELDKLPTVYEVTEEGELL